MIRWVDHLGKSEVIGQIPMASNADYRSIIGRVNELWVRGYDLDVDHE